MKKVKRLDVSFGAVGFAVCFYRNAIPAIGRMGILSQTFADMVLTPFLKCTKVDILKYNSLFNTIA